MSLGSSPRRRSSWQSPCPTGSSWGWGCAGSSGSTSGCCRSARGACRSWTISPVNTKAKKPRSVSHNFIKNVIAAWRGFPKLWPYHHVRERREAKSLVARRSFYPFSSFSGIMMGTFRDFFLPLMPPLPVNTPHLKVTLAGVDIFMAGFVDNLMIRWYGWKGLVLRVATHLSNSYRMSWQVQCYDKWRGSFIPSKISIPFSSLWF